MKIKAIIVTLGLIITMFSGMGANYLQTTTNDVENKNIILSEKINTEDEVVEMEENEVEQKLEEIQQEKQAEFEKLDEEIEVKQEEIKQAPEGTPNKSSQTTPSVTQNNTPKENKQATTPVQEEKKETVVDPPKQETPVEKTITPSDLEYWCVSGGSHHIAGDGANEHGYYSSWDEAYQAFLNYTSGWSSVQFKISQCSCGLYYFWAIE